MRIEGRGDLQQRRQQGVVIGAGLVMASKVLHGSCPVDVGEQAVVAQAEALQHFGRSDIEHFLQRGASSHLVNLAQQEHRAQQAGDEQGTGCNRDPP